MAENFPRIVCGFWSARRHWLHRHFSAWRLWWPQDVKAEGVDDPAFDPVAWKLLAWRTLIMESAIHPSGK